MIRCTHEDPRSRLQLTGCAWLNTGGRNWTPAGAAREDRGPGLLALLPPHQLPARAGNGARSGEHSDVAVTVGVQLPGPAPGGPDAWLPRWTATHHPPRVDDPELSTRDAYTARAWPTLVVVDPGGVHRGAPLRRSGLESWWRARGRAREAKGTLHRGTADGAARAPRASCASRGRRSGCRTARSW
ncbi:hypothetical protein QJS66_17785 [Kocuria rhizophila]|nr:hypothetical protein QJS66_17785 [Kocuria rhizophila]